eukprot:gnl/Chilomastix_cuspidata/1081.p1 GENE.gnl/Chilomastix_cuspidata/1081~~gnl/Chilomastix_cuspidata/1081.p1  ORF type:complete len:824 (-),score=313.56 gnl/Chilomastix_cuspidata/1081:1901-4159(-)
MFVFGDLLQSPPSPFEDLQTNVKSCFEEILANVEDNPAAYANDFEFQQALSDVLIPLKDPHTMYSKPSCYQKFVWLLPFTLRSALDGDEQRLYVDSLPPSYAFYQDLYAQSTGRYLPDWFYGAEVVAINGTADPVTQLADWADSFVYVSKIRDSRFNQALQNDFWCRSMRYYGVPPRSIDITVLDAAGAEQTFTVEWGATNKVAIYSDADFHAFCPVLDVEFSNEANSLSSALDAQPLAAKKAPRTLSPGAAFAAEMKESSAHFRGAAARVKPLTARATEFGYLEHIIYDSDVSLYRFTPPEGSDDSRVIFLLNIPSFSPDDVEGFVDDLLEGLDVAQSEGVTHLVVNVISNGGGWVTLGYRVLRVIAPGLFPEFGNYDIRHSGVAELMLPTALNQETEPRLDPSTYELFKDDDWYTDAVEKSFDTFAGCTDFASGARSTARRDGVTEEIKYSQQYIFELAYDEHSFQNAFDKLDAYEFVSLPPQNIAIVTDGLCGSTCACFSKHAQENHVATMVGIGGLYGAPASEMDVASFAGGSVSDSGYVEEYLSAADYSTGAGVPYPMPTDGYVRFAFEEVFSWNTSVSTPLEFHINPVDLKLPYWPRAGEWWTEDLAQLVNLTVAAVFDVYATQTTSFPDSSAACLPWMKIPADDACEGTISNGVGGYQCAASGAGYDTSTCVAFECNDGYYLDIASGSCTEVPGEGGGLSVLAIVLICVAAVIVVAVVAVLLAKFVFCKKAGPLLSKQEPSSTSD